MAAVRFLKLHRYGIFRQLQLEEALFRNSSENWCIISRGTEPASIVMGISGKPEKLVDVPRAAKDAVPVIKRFTGGGTVIVDSSSIFVTFIGDVDWIRVKPWPREIMEWSGKFYNQLFESDLGFNLQENDYCFGAKKFGGNAQAVSRNRFVHHTSFLWEYDRANMGYLLLPEKRPDYRGTRSHDDFLVTMRSIFDGNSLGGRSGESNIAPLPIASAEDFEATVERLIRAEYDVADSALDEAQAYLEIEHRSSTRYVPLEIDSEVAVEGR